MQLKALTIFGTRPEAIKLSSVIHVLQGTSGITSKVVSTGQHHEMLDQVLHVFQIVPDHDLSVMASKQDLPPDSPDGLPA